MNSFCHSTHLHYLCKRMRKGMTILMLMVSVLMAAQTVQNATADEGMADAIVRQYTVADGLPNNIVNSVLRTSDGFIWFGSWYGISRFDGLGFQNFTNIYSLNSDQPPRKVETMVEDGEGNIWIKTLDWRVTVLFKREDRFKDLEGELRKITHNLQIIKIQNDGYGNVLLLTKDKNLLMGSTTANGQISLRLIGSSKGEIDPTTLQLRNGYADMRNGYASWVGKDFSIFAVKLPRARHGKDYYRQYFSKKAAEARTHNDKTGTLWTLTDKTLSGHNNRTGKQVTYELARSRHITQPAFYELGNSLFVLTSGGEALQVNTQTMTIAPLRDANSQINVPTGMKFMGMLLDPDGILWLTTSGEGVYKVLFPPRQFEFVRFLKDESDGIRALFQLPDGEIWAGARNKDVYIFNPDGQLRQVLTNDEYGIGSIYNIMLDSRGRLWLSTKGDGLVLGTRDKSQPCGWKFKHFRPDKNNKTSISGKNVYVAYEDSRHHIWAGTLDGGLNLLSEHGDSIVFYNKQNGMIHYPGFGLYMEVRNMTEDRDGNLWIGTIDGLMAIDTHFKSIAGMRFDTFRGRTGSTRANTDIYTMYKDSRSNIWVCAFGGGLSRMTGFDRRNHVPLFVGVGRREGLENDVIVSVAEDKKGQLWLAGSHELSCYNDKAKRVRTFGRADGLPDIDIEEGTALSCRNGEMWIGCKGGILKFNPDKLTQKGSSFPIYIVGCTINNEDIRNFDKCVADSSITYTSEIKLKHDQNMLTMTFAALNYTDQNNIIFRHRLEGFDNGWHYDGHDRMASYSQVPPGTYTFIVEAYDGSNPNQTGERRLTITILPPWWATWWAYTLYIIAALTAAWFAFRYVRYQIRLKNDLYVQNRIAEFKRKFTLEQEDAQFVEKVNNIIDAKMAGSDFAIENIARELGMSRSAFFKKIKTMTGDSPSEYVKNRKLAKAVEMLRNTDSSISDVAYACGFSDVGYFGKCFRKKYGMSPRSYKKQE